MTSHNNTNLGDQTPPNSTLKLCDGISPIAVVWRRLVSKVSVVMIGYSLYGCLDDLQFWCWGVGRSEAILHVQTKLHRHADIVAFGLTFDDALCVFNTTMETDLKLLRHACIVAFGLTFDDALFGMLVVSQLEYSRVIGCLMYAMTCTRPDIAFVVGKLSRYTSNPGFLAQSIRSSNAIALDSSYLLVLITGTSQSRQHVDTSLIHLESRKSPTAELFDVDSGRISIHHCEY
nr:zinc finger, CCHC-type [Tanacetum cinerariifolium]